MSSAPSPEVIRGDWDGTRDPEAVLREAIRRLLLECLRRRGFWAERGGEVDTARAVAYQSVAGDLQRILDGAR